MASKQIAALISILVLQSITCSYSQLLSVCNQTALTPDHDYYCVVPSCDISCPSVCQSRCQLLQFYTTAYFRSNTTFHFLSGTHSHTNHFELDNIHNLTFSSLASDPERTVTINCSKEHQVGFVFNGCSRITIQSLTFLNCGQEFITPLPLNQTFHAALAYLNVRDLTLHNVSIINSSVQGLFVYGIQGDLTILSSKFIGAGSGQTQINSDSNISGNSITVESNSTEVEQSKVYIDRSEFVNNTNRPISADVNENGKYNKCDHLAAGLAILLQRSNVDVQLMNIILRNNSGCRGGNLAIEVRTKDPFIGHILLMNTIIEYGWATFGGGLYIQYSTIEGYFCDSSTPQSKLNVTDMELITIANTTFEYNKALGGGGLYVKLMQSLSICTPVVISIEDNCLFQFNSLTKYGYGGAAIHSVNFLSYEYKKQTLPQFYLNIKESYFTNQKYLVDSKWHNSGSGVIYLKTNHHVMIENISIYGNQYSGIVIVGSKLIVSGLINIYNNSGSSGGGMLFCADSVMFMSPHTTVNITNNSAEHAGGGICVEEQCLQSKPSCFFQVSYEGAIDQSLTNTTKINVHNNRAAYAGDQIYGGAIDFCYFINSPYHNISVHEGESEAVYKKFFSIKPDEIYSVTSPQRQVCLCNKNINGSITLKCPNERTDKSVEVYPGEPFNISVAVVGQLQGIVPGTVVTDFNETERHSSQLLPVSDKVQKTTGKSCVTLNYTVYTNVTSIVVLRLSVQFIGDKSFAEHLNFFQPLFAPIKIKKCPLGFTIEKETYFHIFRYHCSCVKHLRGGFKCFISNRTIASSPGNWIGFTRDECNENETCIFYSIGCAVDYCKSTNPDYDKTKEAVKSEDNEFSNQDVQCNFNRTGKLCGACPENYSVILGTSNCIDDCSNISLLLIPLFGVIGILLVVFLMAMNMTVTEGTINALLFYANIVHISNRVFFRGKEIKYVTRLLSVFIAWLNLDFGIHACLYKGMDEYTKAWLQFVFPLYIWIITGVIIYLSRRSMTVSRLVKKNGIKVLATLVLLSYAKMLRASIAAIHFKKIVYLSHNGTYYKTSSCWYSDCNLQYMKGKHIPLGIVGFLSTICLLPFAFLLLFTDLLSKMRLFKCIWRLKPFLDTYTGPYTNEGRHWTGLLLVARVALFVSSSFNHSTGVTSLNVTLANTTIVFLLILPWFLPTGIYRKRWLNVLEGSLLLNLGFFTTGTQYLLFYHHHQGWLTHISVGTAFITFILIIVYHIFQFEVVRKIVVKIKKKYREIMSKLKPSRLEMDTSTQINDDEELLSKFPPLVRFDQEREPLLFDTN